MAGITLGWPRAHIEGAASRGRYVGETEQSNRLRARAAASVEEAAHIEFVESCLQGDYRVALQRYVTAAE